jgi:hypothetical protein
MGRTSLLKYLTIYMYLDRHPSVPLVPGGGEVIEMDHVIKLAPSNHQRIFNDLAPNPPPPHTHMQF